ncbi:hypothetical protein SLOPH_1916 [Spraguea lophii 42_110]|uniref:SLC26A/SulP transporter domain-containing protein n=1 Tax=Spraguea lophii (strain 42_110) TaxID=1358809 RepID=S7W889_SPRLO|nr:hypothetical protein SLOPH_1916 [Spraguea lophii 42_110]
MSNQTTFSGMISSCFLGMILTLLDVLSYGRNIYGNTGNPELENMGIAIFIYTTIIAQISYNIFTSIESGVVAGFICENTTLLSSLFLYCSSFSDDIEVIHTNFYICRILSVLLFSMISISLKAFKVESIIMNIPEPAISGCLAYIGISQIKMGYSEVDYDNYKSIYLIIIALTLALAMYVLTEIAINSNYTLPMSCLVFVVFFYIIAYLKYKKDTLDILRELEWIGKLDKTKVYPTQLFKHFNISKISKNIIFKCLPKSISISLFSIIHIAINLPAFFAKTKTSYIFSNELKNQSISNLLTSFMGGHNYFIASYSILFNKSGGTKTSGIILGFCLLIIPIFGPVLKGFIPKALLSALPMLMGLYFIVPTVLSYHECFIFEYCIIYITVLLSEFTEIPIIGLAGGYLSCLILHFIHKMSNKPSIIIDVDAPVIRITHSLTFWNINKLVEDMARNKNNEIIILDLYQCIYIDWNARIKLSEIFSHPTPYVILIVKDKILINSSDVNSEKLYKVNNHDKAIELYYNLVSKLKI